MAESSINVEVAHKLQERTHKSASEETSKRHREARIEILEAFLLAVVAIATAWSGYQAARWDGRSAEGYAEATALRVEGDGKFTLGGQQRLHDVTTFNSWLQAKMNEDQRATDLLERRFSADYKPFFEAWLATNPFENPSAVAGPAFMPGFSNRLDKEASDLLHRANEAFETGRASREIGEEYVRLSVFLATVLFLVAISQRFSYRKPQNALLAIACAATIVTIGMLLSYPRA